MNKLDILLSGAKWNYTVTSAYNKYEIIEDIRLPPGLVSRSGLSGGAGGSDRPAPGLGEALKFGIFSPLYLGLRTGPGSLGGARGALEGFLDLLGRFLNDQQTRWHWLGEGGLHSSHSASSASGSEYTGQDTVTQPGSCAVLTSTDIRRFARSF